MIDHVADLVITRIFDAPRERVFKAWTDPRQVARWWGPHGFTDLNCEMDVRPGGAFCIQMRGPDGVVYPNHGVFREIVEPERLVVSTSAFEDENGNPQLEVLTTVTFAEHNGKTKLTLRQSSSRRRPRWTRRGTSWRRPVQGIGHLWGVPWEITRERRRSVVSSQ